MQQVRNYKEIERNLPVANWLCHVYKQEQRADQGYKMGYNVLPGDIFIVFHASKSSSPITLDRMDDYLTL